MMDYQIEHTNILIRLRQTRRKETTLLFLTGLFKTISIVFLTVLLASALEFAAHGDVVFRSALAGLIALSFIIPAGIYILPALLRASGVRNSPSVETIALRVGAKFPEIKDRLCNVIQLIAGLGKPNGSSRELAIAAFEDISVKSADKDFNSIIDHNELKRIFVYFLFSLIIASAGFGLFQSSLGEAFFRIRNFDGSFLPPAPYSITIHPLSATALRGETGRITVRAKGKAPETVKLYLKEALQDNYDEYTLRLDTGGAYRYELPSIKHSVKFFAEGRWLSSALTTKIGSIEVVDLPLVRSLSGRIIYPSYARLAPKDFNEKTADISALKGSFAELTILANKDIDKAEIVLTRNKSIDEISSDSSATIADTTFIQMKTDGANAVGKFTIAANGTYSVRIADKDGERNKDPIRYGVTALNDAFPTINLLLPPFDVQLSENAILPVKAAISDDYGFSSLKLMYRLEFSRYAPPDEEFSAIDVHITGYGLILEIPYIWDLKEIDISPEDRYEYYLEVFDNDVVSGPKSARTRTMSVRLPSLDEVLNEADAAQREIRSDLEKVLKEAEKIDKEMSELNRELLKKYKKKQIDWKEKKMAGDIKNKQEELQKRLSKIQENLENMTEKLRENKALSPETLQKFLELQKLMKEVNSAELRALQKQMERAMDKITPQELQKAMMQAKFNEEQFRKSIERTIKILKRLQAEQKIDALTKRAEELAEKQEELEKKTENANPNDKNKRDEISKQQKNAGEDLDKMTEELEELEKLMKEIGDDMPMDQLQKAKQELNQQETQEQMNKSSSQCKSGQFNKACKNQRKSSQNLRKFADEMKKLKKEMEKRSVKEAIRKMQKAISDLLQLSKDQEALKKSCQSSDFNSTSLPDMARRQAEMRSALDRVANSMLELSEKSFAFTPEMGKQIGDALNQMQKAIGQISERRPSQAAKTQSGSMSSLNQAVSQMQQMLSALKQQGGGSCKNPGGQGQGKPGEGSFGDQLQRLAAQQQGINQAMQQMAGGQGGKLSMEQQAELGRIASDQGKASKSLQELAKEQKEFGGEKKALGDLERIAKEMSEVVSDLQNRQIRPETLDKQERILSRLLDAVRSVHDRDYEKNRESKSGKDYRQKNPAAIDLTTAEGKKRALQELLRSIQQGYTKDYEELIRNYFEALKE